MTEKNLMNEEQQGSIKDHSPLTAIACIGDILMESAEENNLASILLIDLTAAYDLIDHEILEEKLKAYKFGPWIKKWI